MRRSWRIVGFVAGALLAHGFLARALYRAALAAGPWEPSKETAVLLAMLCDGLVMAGLAAAGMAAFGLKRSAVFPAAWTRRTALAAGGLGLLLPLVNHALLTLYFPDAEPSSSVMAAYLAGKGTLSGAALGLGIVLVAPLVEEIYFRGLLQGALGEVSSAAALFVATALFIGAHPGSLSSPAMWILGAALGLVYHRTRSISATVVCHAVNNAVAVLVLPLLSR